MPPAAIVTLIGAGILVLGLAFYLIWVAVILRSVIDTLGKINFGVRSIAHQTQPVNPLVGEIREDVETLRSALTGLLESKAEQARSEVAG